MTKARHPDIIPEPVLQLVTLQNGFKANKSTGESAADGHNVDQQAHFQWYRPVSPTNHRTPTTRPPCRVARGACYLFCPSSAEPGQDNSSIIILPGALLLAIYLRLIWEWCSNKQCKRQPANQNRTGTNRVSRTAAAAGFGRVGVCRWPRMSWLDI